MYRPIAAALAILVAGCVSPGGGAARTPRLGDPTPFGIAKGRRQISTWTVSGKWEDLELYADIVSSISAFGGISKEFLKKCHDADIEVYMPVAADETAVLLFDTPEHAAETARGLVERCERLGADGVDLDYECFDCEWQDQYTDFIFMLADMLHRRGLKLTICVNVLMPGDTGEHARYNPKVIGEVCDQIRVMCYDYLWPGNGQLGTSSTRPWARDGMLGWLEHVPREKLVMGISTHSWDLDLFADSGRRAGPGKPPVEPDAIIKKGRLPYEGINYYVYRDKKGRSRLWYASDVYSLKEHLKTMDELDIPAFAFWTGNRATPEMWQAVREWLATPPKEKAAAADRPARKAEPEDPVARKADIPAQSLDEAVSLDLGGGATMELVLIRPGSFTRETGDEVEITQPFYIGRYEVTQKQWTNVMDFHPSDHRGEQRPVERVCWHDCLLFMKELETKFPGRTFRLPTEAEWEYACRAGSSSAFCFGDDEETLKEYAWYKGGPHRPVGRKKPNAWRLYDMHGNVAEWCNDWYVHGYEGVGTKDPRGPVQGKYRVVRGGSYRYGASYCRSSDRSSVAPIFRNCCIGFRTVMTMGGGSE